MRARDWTIIGGVSAVAAYFLSGIVNVSFEDSPVAWSYQVAVVVGLVGVIAWATAKVLRYLAPNSN